jgi:Fe-S cluster biosynthesis and repair protein YggX
VSDVSRKVNCKKFNEELPGLSSLPFPGDLGQKIYDSVSERAWRLWSEDMMIKVINEYRLNLADSADYDRLLDQMRAFLGLSDSQSEVLEVENPNRGK